MEKQSLADKIKGKMGITPTKKHPLPAVLPEDVPAKAPKPAQVAPKKAKRPKGPERTARFRDEARKVKERLPDTSMVTAVYDAATEKWHAVLSIPKVEQFKGVSDGLFRLLDELDDQWRAYREAQKAAPVLGKA